MAPELLYNEAYDYKVDVWALGMIYYFLLTGIPVFDSINLRQHYSKIKQGTWTWPANILLSI